MWISYAGKDSGKLVEAFVQLAKKQLPTLDVKKYKKRIEVAAKLSDGDQAETGPKGDDEWPVDEIPSDGARVGAEEFYLLSMESLFELVLEIAFESRVLVILSPAYFQSEPCLQELAALCCRKDALDPLFILNGVTHDEIRQGQITVENHNATTSTTINLTKELATTRAGLPQLDSFDLFGELSEATAKLYLQKLASLNVPEISVDGAQTIATAVDNHFRIRESTDKYQSTLRDSDCRRYVDWFSKGFGVKLFEKLNEGSKKYSAKCILDELFSNTVGMVDTLSNALHELDQSRVDSDRDRQRWNLGISELAGLYALTLIDYDTFASLGELSRGSDLQYLNFSAGERQTSLRASVVNATIRNSYLRLMPLNKTSVPTEIDTPSISLRELDSSASSPNKHAEREFVETLYAWALQKTRDDCPKGNPDHTTRMNERERQDLRGRINAYRNRHGIGSLVLIVEKGRFSVDGSWWDLWVKVHDALNDGAVLHGRVMLQGVVITENNNTSTIRMHPDFEERLTYVEDLLNDFYLK